MPRNLVEKKILPNFYFAFANFLLLFRKYRGSGSMKKGCKERGFIGECREKGERRRRILYTVQGGGWGMHGWGGGGSGSLMTKRFLVLPH